ncbi:class I SAM-dependent methyltransferase [Clostridium sp. AL.422]|uniref:class I SAM-dependent methyltransferase n=1 Tax=Clostridium TaxID=1485 RepID=UPI00293DD204|nr:MULTISPECIES: class I SAM-dependent methyltransferase [unclassified Clostridium]MDV4151737.1 class I SAM-dependent methyltransferase [Clostridium sp. AL.422]
MSYLFKFYSKQYDKFMKKFHLDKNKLIIKELKNIYGLEILDIGGGTGTLAKELISLGAKVTILDPEINMTKIAKEKSKDIKIINGYSDNISLRDSSVDLVIMRDSFHHILKKEETLRECKRVLKKEGRILIYEFDKNSFIGKVIFIFETLCFERIEMLTINEMKRLAYKYFKNGEIIEISKYEYIYIGSK